MAWFYLSSFASILLLCPTCCSSSLNLLLLPHSPYAVCHTVCGSVVGLIFLRQRTSCSSSITSPHLLLLFPTSCSSSPTSCSSSPHLLLLASPPFIPPLKPSVPPAPHPLLPLASPAAPPLVAEVLQPHDAQAEHDVQVGPASGQLSGNAKVCIEHDYDDDDHLDTSETECWSAPR